MIKLRHLAFGSGLLTVILVGACGGAGDDDGGTNDASNDTTSQPDSSGGDASQDSASQDAPSDATKSDSGDDDGGLNQGETCNPQNDKCKPGLKCCQGGVIVVDAGNNNYKCLQEGDSGNCPIVP